MSIEENVAELSGVVETVEHAMQQTGEAQQFGADAITGLQGVAGGTPPQHLEQAMQMISEAQHQNEQAQAVYGSAIEQINEYIQLLSS